MSKTFQYKLVLLGESAVGKSSLVMRFVRGTFLEYQEATIGASFLTQTVVVDDFTVKFEIWDTAGQERYHALAPMYYRGANAAVVVYDITSEESFERAKKWVQQLQREAGDPVIAFVGNKTDLVEERQVPLETGQAYASERKLIFLETSAKTGDNVSSIFLKIGESSCTYHYSAYMPSH